MKRLLAFLALCLPIYILAQGFGSFTHDQPYFAKDIVAGGSSFTPYAYSNLYRWWHSEDLPVGVVVSNQWLDRIVGDVMQQGDATRRPTNSSTGVYFDGTDYLTNNPIPLADDPSMIKTYAYVMNLDPARAYAGTAPLDIWKAQDTPNGQGLSVVHTPGPGRWVMTDRNFGSRFSVGLCPSNTWFDLILHSMSFYTNSVVDVENPAVTRTFTGEQYFGTREGDPGFRILGYVRDILIWTNVVDISSNSMPYVTRSNIHHSFTNFYQYSP